MIKNVSEYNFDYRVVRRTIKNKEGQPILDSDDKPMCEYWIQEIHFGEHGEIVAYAGTPEIPCGMDMDELRSEMKELTEALTKPVLDWEMVKKETRNSARRMKRAIRRELAQETTNKDGKSRVEKAAKSYEKHFEEQDSK